VRVAGQLLLLQACFLACQCTDPNCTEIGFTDALVCSSCDKLAKHVTAKGLEADCRSCCTDDSSNVKVSLVAVLCACFGRRL
jgi:hypothetical protein